MKINWEIVISLVVALFILWLAHSFLVTKKVNADGTIKTSFAGFESEETV